MADGTSRDSSWPKVSVYCSGCGLRYVIELRTSEIGFACPACGGGDIRADRAKEAAEKREDSGETET